MKKLSVAIFLHDYFDGHDRRISFFPCHAGEEHGLHARKGISRPETLRYRRWSKHRERICKAIHSVDICHGRNHTARFGFLFCSRIIPATIIPLPCCVCKQEQTALRWACSKGHFEVTKWLASTGTNLGAKDKWVRRFVWIGSILNCTFNIFHVWYNKYVAMSPICCRSYRWFQISSRAGYDSTPLGMPIWFYWNRQLARQSLSLRTPNQMMWDNNVYLIDF